MSLQLVYLCVYVYMWSPNSPTNDMKWWQRNINGVSGSGENRDQQVIYYSVGAAGVSLKPNTKNLNMWTVERVIQLSLFSFHCFTV